MKQIAAFSPLHGPSGRSLADYSDNILSLWGAAQERLTGVANTGFIYTAALAGYPAGYSLPEDKPLLFSPHVQSQDGATLSINGSPALPLQYSNGTSVGFGDLQPGTTVSLRKTGAAYIIQALPTFSIIETRNFTDLGAREGTAAAQLARNNSALRLAAASGKPYKTEPGSLFRFSVGANFLFTSGSGIINKGSTKSVFEMACAAGQFDSADFLHVFDPNRVLISAASVERLQFDGLHFRLEDPPAGVDRTAYPMYLGDCLDTTLGDLEASNFKHNDGGLFRIGSSRGTLRVGTLIGRDCNPDFPFNPAYQTLMVASRQISTLEIDNFRIAGAYSIGTFLFSSIEGYNLLPSKTVRDDYLRWDGVPFRGAQTDVLNIQTLSPNTFFTIGDRVVGIGVGEVLDIWSSNFTIGTIYGRDVYDTGPLKIVYGAARGSIGLVDAQRTGLGVVYIQPANNDSTRPFNCRDVTIGQVRASNVGSLYQSEWLPRGKGMDPAITIASSAFPQTGTSNLPENIHLPDVKISSYIDPSGPTSIMTYGVGFTGGPNCDVNGSILDAATQKVSNNGAYKIQWRDTDLGNEESLAGLAYLPVISFASGNPTGFIYTSSFRGYRAFGRVHGNIQLSITNKGVGGAGQMRVSLPLKVSNEMFFPVTVDFSNFDLSAGFTGITGICYEDQQYLLLRQVGDSIAATDITPTNLCPGGNPTVFILGFSYIEAVA